MRTVIGAIVVLSVILAACDNGEDLTVEGDQAESVEADEALPDASEDSSVAEEPEPAPEPEEQESVVEEAAEVPPMTEGSTLDLAREYLGFMGEPSPRTIAEMISLAEEGSDAHAYASFMVSQVLAHSAEGIQVDPWSISTEGDGFQVCTDTCVKYNGFEESDGLLTTFSLNDRPLEGRILGPGDAIEAGPATVRATSSYEASSDDSLVVTFLVEAREPVSVVAHSADYVGPTGAQQSATISVGPFDLRGGSSAHYMVMFSAADIGGTVYVTLWDDANEQYEVALSAG